MAKGVKEQLEHDIDALWNASGMDDDFVEPTVPEFPKSGLSNLWDDPPEEKLAPLAYVDERGKAQLVEEAKRTIQGARADAQIFDDLDEEDLGLGILDTTKNVGAPMVHQGLSPDQWARLLLQKPLLTPDEVEMESDSPVEDDPALPKGLNLFGKEHREKLMATLMEWAAVNTTLTFGKYKGTTWDKVPSDYLVWVANNFESGTLRDRGMIELLLRKEATLDDQGVISYGRDSKPLSDLGKGKIRDGFGSVATMPFAEKTSQLGHDHLPKMESKDDMLSAARGALHSTGFNQELVKAFPEDFVILSNTFKSFPGGPYSALLVAVINDPTTQAEKVDDKSFCIKTGGKKLNVRYLLTTGGLGWQWDSIEQEAEQVERASDPVVA